MLSRIGYAVVLPLYALAICSNSSFAQCEEMKIMASVPGWNELFGSSVDMHGATAIVGACKCGPETEVGSVFIFRNVKNDWIQEVELTSADGDAGDEFGRAAAIWEETCIVGAAKDSDVEYLSGAAYIFRYDSVAESWVQDTKLVPSDWAWGARFGWSVDIEGDVAVVGAYHDDDNGELSGSAYVYRRIDRTWTLESKLVPADGAPDARFGVDVAVHGDCIVVGAFRDDVNGDQSGSAYTFRYNADSKSWEEQSKLIPSDGAEVDQFGTAVALDEDVIVIGAPLDDDSGYQSGSAYVYRWDTGLEQWIEEAKLTPADGAAQDAFGIDVDVDGQMILVGASKDDGYGGINSGSAYLFQFDGSAWPEIAKLTTSDSDDDDRFGHRLAIDGTRAIIGAQYNNNVFHRAGSAYVFGLDKPGIDCNGNGMCDATDIADGVSADCNGNYVPDECDIAAQTSADCDRNGVPDECDLVEGGVTYLRDDGTAETAIDVRRGGGMIWLNHFVAEPGGELIVAVDVSWAYVPSGTPTDIAVWDDPDNDGHPGDAQLLTVVRSVPASRVGELEFVRVPIPPTSIGPVGQGFFVGAHLSHEPGDYPAAFDVTGQSQESSWIAGGDNLVDLSANEFLENIDSFGNPGNFLIRAVSNGPADADSNGIIDLCQCPADLSGDNNIGPADLAIILGNWGPVPPSDPIADLNDDGVVGPADLAIVLGNWGPC